MVFFVHVKTNFVGQIDQTIVCGEIWSKTWLAPNVRVEFINAVLKRAADYMKT